MQSVRYSWGSHYNLANKIGVNTEKSWKNIPWSFIKNLFHSLRSISIEYERNFRVGWFMWQGILCLLIGTYWSEAPILLQRKGDRDPVFLELHFKGIAPRFLRKTLLGCRQFIYQRGRERIYNCKFSNVNALRKICEGPISGRNLSKV